VDRWIRPFSTNEKGKELCNAAEKNVVIYHFAVALKACLLLYYVRTLKQYRETAIGKKGLMQPNLKFMNKSHQPSAPTSPEMF
jgi:hypothetical protein